MRPKAEWTIDSEAMRPRGIIVLATLTGEPVYGAAYLIMTCALVRSFNKQ